MNYTVLKKDEFLPQNKGDCNSTVYYRKDTTLAWEKNSDKNVTCFIKAEYKNGQLQHTFIQCYDDSLKKQENNIEFKNATLIDLKKPIELVPVEIEKPWGKEIWYTGIEERGVSLAKQRENDQPIRLSCLISIFGPALLQAPQRYPTLLKILAPKDHPLTGNLYYELHEEKQEVYIVTKVSEKYPNSIGKMKYGISKDKLEELGNNVTTFKYEMLKAYQEYEKVRKQVEFEFDKIREISGYTANESLTDEVLETFYQKLPPNLKENEAAAKQKAEEFVGWINIKVGDVINVETRVPHSLQHGIEVIEFQTPVYERKIISFDQKTLTQSNWDSKDAIEKIRTDYISPTSQTGPIIARFDDFTVSQASELKPANKERIIYNLSPTQKTEPHGLKQNSAYFIASSSKFHLEKSEKNHFIISEPSNP